MVIGSGAPPVWLVRMLDPSSALGSPANAFVACLASIVLATYISAYVLVHETRCRGVGSDGAPSGRRKCDDFGFGWIAGPLRRCRGAAPAALGSRTPSPSGGPRGGSPSPRFSVLRRSPSSASGSSGGDRTPPTVGGGRARGGYGGVGGRVDAIRTSASEVDIKMSQGDDLMAGVGSKGEATRTMFYILVLIASTTRLVFALVESASFLIKFATGRELDLPLPRCGCFYDGVPSSDGPSTQYGSVLCIFLRTAPSVLCATAFSLPVLFFSQLEETLRGRFSSLPRPVFVGMNAAVYLIYFSHLIFYATYATSRFHVNSMFLLLATIYITLSVTICYFGCVLYRYLGPTLSGSQPGLSRRIASVTAVVPILFACRAAGLLLACFAGSTTDTVMSSQEELNTHFNALGTIVFELCPLLLLVVLMHRRYRPLDERVLATPQTPAGLRIPYGGKSMRRVSSSGGGYRFVEQSGGGTGGAGAGGGMRPVTARPGPYGPAGWAAGGGRGQPAAVRGEAVSLLTGGHRGDQPGMRHNYGSGGLKTMGGQVLDP